jgi:hypothetical protein
MEAKLIHEEKMKVVFICRGDGDSQQSLSTKFSIKYPRGYQFYHKTKLSLSWLNKQETWLTIYVEVSEKIYLMKQQQQKYWIIFLMLKKC